MFENVVMKTAAATVPHWYTSETGRHTYSLKHGGVPFNFQSHNPMTPNLYMLHGYMQNNIGAWMSRMPGIPSPRFLQQVEEDIAIRWLEMYDEDVDWTKFIAYIEQVRFRTYENNQVRINYIIGAGKGSVSMTDSSIQKIVDPLSSSMQVYFRVDRDLRFLDYQEILWKQVSESLVHRFVPEFLEPFASTLQEGEFSVHLHEHGDIFIMNSGGLIAANRKGRWRVYDAQTFKYSVCGVTGNMSVGANLFELMFDLSYRRHGALLVYDPRHAVLEHIVNPQSMISSKSIAQDAARAMLGPVIRDIAMGRSERIERKKNLLLEIAGLDGAIVFDDDEIIAIGAMIRQHSSLTAARFGARSIAAQSAYCYGAVPVKISADGEIQLLFKSVDNEGRSSDAEMVFM